MTILSYKDVALPFDTEMTDGHVKVRLLACVSNDYSTKIIGYTFYGDDPTTNCSQVLDWDENGVFSGGRHPTMDLVPPPGMVESTLRALDEEMAAIRQRLADNPKAPEAWRATDEAQLRRLESKAQNLAAPHIWDRAA